MLRRRLGSSTNRHRMRAVGDGNPASRATRPMQYPAANIKAAA
jgi:hypothetical protein